MVQSINKFIGESIRVLRKANNSTLIDLAKILGISYQQLQKYETGANKISAEKLFEIAQIFGTDLRFFFPRR